MEPQSEKIAGKSVVIIVITILLIIALAYYILRYSNNKQNAVSNFMVIITDTSKNNASQYKDGTYSATGAYNSPGGSELIKVDIKPMKA